MSHDHNNGNGRLDMGRGCMFCGCRNEGNAHNTDGGSIAVAENNGTDTIVCEGCFKLHETDWLADYPDNAPTDIFEVRFKNTRKGYYKNIHDLPLRRGDIVAVEASPGHDVGIVSLTGDMVARQMKRVGFNAQNGEFKAIHRKAKPYDIEKWQEAIALEHETMIRSRRIAKEMKLDMKIGDVEYQGDKIKAIFYYIADGRVDFRELIKVFASEFGIKVEMKQIGARQEAGRIGGLGSCGRELCCASWISSFSSVTTGAARTQDISLNPQKLAGQCCKLKCCLVYELDTYIDARKSLPRVNEPLQALDGDYYLVSSDVLRRTMSFSTVKGMVVGNVILPVAKVREVIEMNRKGKKPDTLASMLPAVAKEEEPAFVDMVGEDSITRFDSGRRKERGGRNRGENRGGGGSGENRDRRGNGGNRSERDARSGNGGSEIRGNRSGNGEHRESRGNEGNRENRGGNGNSENRPQNSVQGNRPNGNRGNNNRPNGDRQNESRSNGERQNNGRPNGNGRNDRNEGGSSRQNGGGENRNNGNRNNGNRNRPPRPKNENKNDGNE